MGYKSINIKIHTGYSNEELKSKIKKQLRISVFSYIIENKSLDARNKRNIHWNLKIGLFSDSIKEEAPKKEKLTIPYKKRNEKVLIIGSGPAGFFAAYTLQKAGFNCTIIERGMDVDKRAKAIRNFEKSATFSETGNYAFGEGGAGTFSDGKLTSRTKKISKEKEYITQAYISAGAPKEIAFMKHPHLGTDNLRKIVKNLRKDFEAKGGKVLFETTFTDIIEKSDKYVSIATNKGDFSAEYLIIASGHSATDTYKILIKNAFPFRTKNFAIGSRAEHYQEVINKAQWGIPNIKGVKAAEYRLTAKMKDGQPVYSFCMCPGGIIVPATAFKERNIVNGMSFFSRNGKFSNAAYVAGIHPNDLLNKEASAIEALDAVDDLERKFYNYNNSYQAPFCQINDFINKKISKKIPQSSYPLGLAPAPLWEMLPDTIVPALQKGLFEFNRKLKGYNNGALIGLESKTSSPVQVIRDKNGKVEGFKNIFMVGEGSGYAGGIMSSAADGVRAAVGIVESAE